MGKSTKVVIGTWPLSGDFGHIGLAQVQSTLEHCYGAGLREFDTAPNYGSGLAELCLGNVFRGTHDVRLNTKFGSQPIRGKSFRIEDLERSFFDSLKRLAVEKVYTLFLHNPRDEVDDYEHILGLMDRLKAAGLISLKGISLAKGYEYPDQVLNGFDMVQDDVNLLYLDSLRRVLPTDVKLTARSPLASGLLAGNKTRATTFSDGDHRAGWLTDERLGSLLRRVEAIERTSARPIAQVARAFLLHDRRVDKVVFGVKSPKHVDDVIADLEAPPLPATLVTDLIALYDDDFGLVNERDLGF